VSAASSVALSSNDLWKPVNQVSQLKRQQSAWVRPANARVVELDILLWDTSMKRIPKEHLVTAGTLAEIITLPMPDGSYARFQVVESPVMQPELAEKFPEIKTYAGVGIDDPHASVRLDWTPQGFHGQILSPNGAVYIDPYSKGNNSLYSVYYKRDHQRSGDFQCTVRDRDPVTSAVRRNVTPLRAGPTLRTYLLACAATAEYTAFHGGTVTQGLAAIVTAVNRVTGVYESELGIRLVLVANNDLLVYTNSVTDPYTNDDGEIMLDENQENVDNIIGTGNYDIGHVFSTDGGGIAGLGVVCNISRKAEGVTGQSSPIGDPFYIDYVAHEIGHQFNAEHTFNSETSSCGNDNREPTTAYEPGSGTTIMSYAGICGADNIQNYSDPYFHSISFDQIINYIELQACDSQSGTGNTAPTVDGGGNFVIPANTPFILTASGSDLDDDPLTYCWEERDLGAATTLAAADNGSSPLFRSFNPTTNAWRTFPRLQNILNGTPSLGEKLPTTSRTMNFRVTARDNEPGGGGVNTDDMVVIVSTNSGPFVVTAPNTSVTWSSLQTVTWNVAKTTGTPVNASSVDIHLSIDGGFTWPFALALGTPNDGSESVILPNITATNSRIKVQGANNIFFDVSNVSFGITTGTPLAKIIMESITFTNESCGDVNGKLDPYEYAEARIVLRNIGSLHATNVTASIITTTNLTSLAGTQQYGTLLAGGASISQSFAVVSSGSCGDTIKFLVSTAIGTNQHGVLTNNVVLGPPVIKYFENTSAIAVPAVIDTLGPADPYPSTIDVAGFIGNIVNVTVTIYGMSHAYPDDIDVLLVGPGGQEVLLMSDVGGDPNINNVQLVFSDSAASSLPNNTAISSGTYKPTNSGASDLFDAPAPAGPYGTTLSTFSNTNPNGVWSLFIMDDVSGDVGIFSGGWSLNIDAPYVGCCTQAVAAPLLFVSPSNLLFGLVATGTTAQLSITVGNIGNSTLTGSVSAAGGPFTLPYSSTLILPPAKSTNVTVQFSPLTTNSVSNSLIFLSNGGDRTNIVSGQGVSSNIFYSDLSVVLVGTPDVVVSSNVMIYDITLTNNGPDAATGIMLTNSPSPYVVFDVQMSSAECVETNGLIICNMSSLVAGGSTTLVIFVTIDPGASGSITNWASVSSANVDTNESDNTAFEVTLIQDLDGDGNPDFVDEDDDGDTVSDEDEFIADTDASDSNSYHRILNITRPSLTEVSFPSSTGRIYFMEISTNLPAHEWIMTGSDIPGIGGVMTIYETNTADALQYRIGVQLP